MTKWTGTLATKVQLTVYVSPRVKRGIRIAAIEELTTASELVERLLVEYLRTKEGIGDLIEKRE